MQIRKINIVLIALLLSFVACKVATEPKEELIGPNKLVDPKGLLTPEVLWSFGRLGEVAVSPDNKFIAYTVTWFSIDKNKGNSELFVMSADGSNKSQLTFTNTHEYNPLWVNDNTIAFLSTEGGVSQIRTINRDGSNLKKVDGFSEDINGFKLSPNGKKLLFIAEVKVGNDVADIYPDLPKTSGMIINDLMYRHWDTWEDSLFSHVFVADFSMEKIENIKDIMPNEPYDAPLKPFGGMEEISWNSDGTAVAYTCKKMLGKEYSFSTDSDIFLYSLSSGETKNLTQGMVGYDKQPVFSPDGKKMTWISMERPGFEADKERLLMLDFETGEKIYLTKNFDYSASNVMWTPDSKSVYFISGVEATYQIYRMDIADQNPVAITKGLHDYHSIAFLGENLVGSKVSITKPAEIYSIDAKSGDEVELSFINKDLLAKIEMPKVDRRWVKSTDGKLVHTWVILPPNFDSTKKYPALLYCEGGPQSAVSQFWSYRWNFSIMAS
ncbi:MAG: S9 family peptidase, partial [Bacteroidales bacterium]